MIRLLVVAVLLAAGARAMYRRAHPATAPTPSRTSAYPADAPVAVVHDAGSAVRNTNADGFADETRAAQLASDDSAAGAASGRGLATKQTWTAPLDPEPARHHAP